MASGVKRKLLCTTAQESQATPVSDPNEEIQIQGERLVVGEEPATTAMRAAKFDLVRSAGDKVTQLFTLKQHRRSSGICSPDDPRARGETKLQFLIGFCSFMQITSSSCSRRTEVRAQNI
jgi:hypothetical protein